MLTCPLDKNGVLLPGTQSATSLFNGAGCANKRTQSLNNSDSENPAIPAPTPEATIT